MLGFAIGVAVTGRSVIVEIMFSDFIAQGLDQIIHQISKLQSIYGQSIEIPLLIRTASGPGRGYGPTHSHTLESQLVGLPNLEVVCANPFISYQDILEVWFEKKVCFIVFEPKELYPYSESDFESSMYQIQLPKNLYEPVQITSKHLKADVTIVVYGSAVWRVIERLDELLFSLEICVEVLIPTVISNWDVSTLYNSLLMSDGKLIVITDNLKSNGFLDSVIIKAFSDGAIKRLECLNFSDWIPSGFSEEEVIHTAARIRETLQRILNR
jgi:pyruvate/2-oxoglutarate/acetoin dehydrogenase E1 component